MFRKKDINPISSYFLLPPDENMDEHFKKILFLIDWASALSRKGKTVYCNEYLFQDSNLEIPPEINSSAILFKLCENIERISENKNSIEDKYIAFVRHSLKKKSLEDVFLDTYPIKRAVHCNIEKIALGETAKEYAKLFAD